MSCEADTALDKITMFSMARSVAIRALLLAATIGIPQTEAQLNIPFRPPREEVLEKEGIEREPESFAAADSFSAAPAPPSSFRTASSGGGNALDPSDFSTSTDSAEDGEGGDLVFDGDESTFWHSQYTPTDDPLPHSITIDMKEVFNVNGLTYLPRQDGNQNGNIGRHEVYLSLNGSNYGSPVAFGTWLDDQSLKISAFETRPARYVRLVALTEAGNRGPWTSAAEIEIYAASTFTPPPSGLGKWGPTIDFPVVPVAAAVEPDSGDVIVWSAQFADDFAGGSGSTQTAIYSPSAGTVTQRTVSNTGHDMFCPGISRDVNGRLIVTGGSNAPKTSIYNQVGNVWSIGAEMNTARGYQSSTTCSDGRIFTVGGSWSGGRGGKDGEIYDPATDSWTSLPDCPVEPILTDDKQGVYRADNHAWLFGWKDGFVFQAGPSDAMHWYGTNGTGSITEAGSRAGNPDSMCGNAIMYDAVDGKILTVGGSINYQNSPGTTAAHIITIDDPETNPNVSEISSMAFNRMFANGVALPDGTVFVVGGQEVGLPFSDEGAHYTPELFDPVTNSFTSLVANTIPRTYHSVAVLMADGTVFVGGGGLCGDCSTNHLDAQIYTPQYLLTASGAPASRPSINSVSSTSVKVGDSIAIGTDSAIDLVALMRYGSNTHSVDTDQRRIPLEPTTNGTTTYMVTIPDDAGVALPGRYMLFVLDAAGVPSVSRNIQITPD